MKKTDIDRSVSQKVLTSIKKIGRFAKKTDIDRSVSHYPDLTPEIVRSAMIYLKKKVVVCVVATKNNRDTFWGLTNWLNVNGAVKEAYMYNANSLV